MITATKGRGNSGGRTGLAGVVLASTVGWLAVVMFVLQDRWALCSSRGFLSQDMAHALSILGMWLAMALAMRLPSASHEIAHAATVYQGRPAKLSVLRFGLGSLAIALLVGLLAAGLQLIFEPIGILTGEGKFSNPAAAGLALLGAGLGELSALVAARRFRDAPRTLADYSSPFLQGLCHGRSTLPRCLAMIGLQFVGGAMNLTWMVTLTLWMFLHATLPWKRHMAAVAGFAFLTAGAMTFFSLKT